MESPVASQLEMVLPKWEWSMQQSIRIRRPAPDVYQAIQAVRVDDMLMARLLSFFRYGRPTPAAQLKRPFLESMTEMGWVPLIDRPGREIVAGLAGRFWEKDFGVRPMRDGQDFAAWAEPGTVKLAFGYRLQEIPEGTRLFATTHVHAVDEEGARRFRAYWALIRIGAGLTVRSGLRAIRRAAERLQS